MSYKNLFSLCKVLNTQFLSPRIKRHFKPLLLDKDIFIYSFQDDPNICQLSLHKDWDTLVFAWIQPQCVYLFRIPKHELLHMNLTLNHADKRMIDENVLFKHSIRLTSNGVQALDEFLVDILE